MTGKRNSIAFSDVVIDQVVFEYRRVLYRKINHYEAVEILSGKRETIELGVRVFPQKYTQETKGRCR